MQRDCLILAVFALFVFSVIQTAIADNLTDGRYCNSQFQQYLSYLAKHRQELAPAVKQRDEMKSWMNLITLFGGDDCPGALDRHLASWLRSNASHPAREIVERLLKPTSSNTVKTVNVLLPLNSDYRREVAAIRRGLQRAATRHRVKLVYRDTTTTGMSVLHQRLENQQVRCIIGPLTKSNVLAFSQVSENKHILALNYLPELVDYPMNFFQMALAPKEQVKAMVAVWKKKNWHKGILIKEADSPWAEEVAANLIQAFNLENGRWLEIRSYSDKFADYSGLVKSSLAVDESIQRKQQLEKILGTSLQFKPRTRPDVEFVVFVGNPRHIRLVYPFLRYWGGEKLPAFMLSPEVISQNNQLEYDLDGLQVLVPQWLDRLDLSGQDVSLVSLQHFGQSAVDIAVNSDCLQSPDLFDYLRHLDDWYLDLDTGRIGYQNRLAIIRDNKLHLQ